MPRPTAASEIARLEAELADVRVAITEARHSQSYSSGETGLARQRAPLRDLVADEQRIMAQLDRLYDGGSRGIRVQRGVPL